MATRARTLFDPEASLLALLPLLSIEQLGRCAEAVIDALDQLYGDPDLEPEEDIAADDLGEEDSIRIGAAAR